MRYFSPRFFTGAVQPRPPIAAQLAVMREDIRQNGSIIVGCDELRVLCLDEQRIGYQFNRIAEIAMQEKWSFTFLPDGSVEFIPLESQS